MLKNPQFIEDEKGAPLFLLDNGFIKAAGDLAFERANGWYDLVFPDGPAEEKELAPVNEADIPRIVIKDAERTFLKPENRLSLEKYLTQMNVEFGDYSQGFGFVASFLYLFMDEKKAQQMLIKVNSDEKYIPGYWKETAIGFATDAYVFDHLLKKIRPGLSEHLAKSYILPEMYCQKWFTNLCVHVLPFENVFQICDNFFAEGYTFLFKFAISLMGHLEKDLMKTNDPGALLGVLRLDKKYLSEPLCYEQIIREAKDIDVTTGVDYPALRKELFEKYLKPRFDRIQKQKEEEELDDDEITFSDEDEDEDDE